ncbi:hypothetical protein LTSEJOH_1196 [Salmonella enterica subsp. enterica serovar Johannesburg str. S5-703]|nr:hypothetical protein LTSEJOH_1196 [Salmonella enterica subsp. enterica serovar Johannesburg str. S5-703]
MATFTVMGITLVNKGTFTVAFFMALLFVAKYGGSIRDIKLLAL